MKVDVAILGAGTAGLNAVREAQKADRSWVLIEPGPYGTTCARVGCMPSKLLIAAANGAYNARHVEVFGLRSRGVEIDGRRVMERLRRERDRFVGFVVESTEELPAERRLKGVARFIGPGSLEVECEQGPVRVEARATVVATGSSPLLPPPFESIRQHVLTSDDIFEIETLPESMAVIGTGVIGIELGQAMSRLDVDVTFLDVKEHVGLVTDPELQSYIDEALGEELRLQMGAKIQSATLTDGGIELCWQVGEDEHRQTFEAVLVAAGRRPNVASLDLGLTGLELDDKGMPPWDKSTTQCGDQPIFLAGDASGDFPLLHEASDEGRIAGENASSWPEVSRHHRRTGLTIVFCEPQLALVGLRHAELEPGSFVIGESSFDNQGRSRVMGQNRGLMRLYGRPGGCFLVGGEMFGPRMEHLAHLLAWAIQRQVPVQKLLEMPIYHPTYEEGMRTALRDLARAMQVEEECRSEDMSQAPGM